MSVSPASSVLLKETGFPEKHSFAEGTQCCHMAHIYQKIYIQGGFVLEETGFSFQYSYASMVEKNCHLVLSLQLVFEMVCILQSKKEFTVMPCSGSAAIDCE